MTVIAFNYPAAKSRKGKAPALKEARGRIAILEVGEQKVRFVLQQNDAGRAVCLTHYLSGQIFGFLDDERVRAMCARGDHAKLTDHQAARSLIARVIDKHGLGVVQHKLASAPVVNQARRVEIPAYTDRWMMGDRYGTAVKRVVGKDGAAILHVKLDKSGKTVKVVCADCKDI